MTVVVLVLADPERHTVRVQPRNRLLVLTVKLDPDAVELQGSFSRDVRGLGCLGIRDGVAVWIGSHEDLARADELIRQWSRSR